MNMQDGDSQSLVADVVGMTCANCALRIEKGLAKLDGVREARINYAGEKLYVKYSGSLLDEEKLYAKVKDLGYEAFPYGKGQSPEGMKNKNARKDIESLRLRLRLLFSVLFSLPLFYTMVGHFSFLHFLPVPTFFMHPVFQFTLSFPVQFFIGFPFYFNAYKALKNTSANMDVLVSLGTSAAFGYSTYMGILYLLNPGSFSHHPPLYFETSAVLITFILFGKWLEGIAKGKSKKAIQGLLNLQPAIANIRKGNDWLEVPSEFLKKGDVFLVRPGERIPADGKIREGSGFVDESMITGESLPVEKKVNSEIIGGTINQKGSLVAETIHASEDSVLASIIRSVESAQMSKAPIQRIADKISAVFVPVVISFSVLTGIIWYFWLSPGNIPLALENSIAVLVIACPCALGLATPVSLLVGTGRGAVMGILFRNAESLERISSVDWMGFDKTGTVTEGKLEVVDVYGWLDGRLYSLDEIFKSPLGLCFARGICDLEKRSEHPLAKAITRFLDMHNSMDSEISISSFQSETGGGVMGTYQGTFLHIGTEDFLEKENLVLPEEFTSTWKNQISSHSTYVVAHWSSHWMVIFLKDQLKSSSRQTTHKLKSMGIIPVLITGDRKNIAEHIVTEIGIEEFYAECKPDKKQSLLEDAKKKGFTTAMVGDGINDAPALASSDVGIAMGNGTDIAMESAEIVIWKGDLEKITQAIMLGKATVSNIYQNFFWALIFNTVGIPIAAMGFLAPWVAGGAMAFSSVFVVLNALRLKTVKI